MLHVLKQGIMQFYAQKGRLPTPNDEADASEIVRLAKCYNASMRTLASFCGSDAALTTIDLEVTPTEPLQVEGLDEAKLEAVNMLKDMGATEERALLVLIESNFDVDGAMGLLFDDAALEKLEQGVNAFKCLAAMKKLALAAGAELQPMAVFMGGICAQVKSKSTSS